MGIGMTLRKMQIVFASLALAGCAHDGPRRVVERRTELADAPRGAALLRRAMMAGHAVARSAVGAPPLAWSDALAADAAIYAAELARTGRFAHSPLPRGTPTQGENLWMGTRGAYRYDEMVGHWAAERKAFKDGLTPNLSRTGDFEDVGHYTQMIWRRTNQVGCAMASNKRNDFLVCRYLPGGNVVGQSPLAP
jgi:hypothetical protein